MNIDFNRIGAIQKSTFFDKCKINNGLEISCGYSANAGGRNFKDPEVQYVSDCTIRVANTETVTTGNMITLTEKSGKTLSIAFRVVNVGIGTGIFVLKCQKVVD